MTYNISPRLPWLTAAELSDYTGRVKPSAQVRQLERMGYREGIEFTRAADGRPKLPLAVIARHEREQTRHAKPDFGALARMD